jgi:hypothetical protein
VASKRELGDTADALHVFRTYANEAHEETPGLADDELIWKVGRATSAAPTYFKPMKIGEDFFSDGGVLYNNPAEVAYDEVLYKEGYYARRALREQLSEPIRLVLSIGTGGNDANNSRDNNGAHPPPRRQRTNIISHFQHLAETLTRAVTDSGRVDKAMRRKSIAGSWRYIRWHGGEGLAKLKLDEWKRKRRSRLGTQGPKISTQEAIEEWVRTYMSDAARRSEIDEVAEMLVTVRRRRTHHQAGDLWKRWTYCSKFTCQFCGDDDYTKTGTEARLEEHLKTCGTRARAPFGPDIPGGPY